MRRLKKSGAVGPLPPKPIHGVHMEFFIWFKKTYLPPPPMAQQPIVCQSLLIIKAPRSHSDTRQSVGLLSKSDQPDAEISTWQPTTLTTDRHAPGGIRTRNPSKWATAGPRLTERCNWDRLMEKFTLVNWLLGVVSQVNYNAFCGSRFLLSVRLWTSISK
jgi:hypothetical protein